MRLTQCLAKFCSPSAQQTPFETRRNCCLTPIHLALVYEGKKEQGFLRTEDNYKRMNIEHLD